MELKNEREKWQDSTKLTFLGLYSCHWNEGNNSISNFTIKQSISSQQISHWKVMASYVDQTHGFSRFVICVDPWDIYHIKLRTLQQRPEGIV